MVYIKIEDATNIVKYVCTNEIEAEAGHTVYNENYNGNYNWNHDSITVIRVGEGDYQ